MEAQDLIFPVKKVPIEELGITEHTASSGITHAVVIRDSRIVNFCSEDYFLRTNQEILNSISSFLEENNLDFTVIGSNFRNVRFKLEFILDHTKFNLGSREIQDPVALSIKILNSYDGSQRYQGSVSVLRLVCKNGLTSSTDLAKLMLSHTPQLADNLDIEKLLASVQESAENMDDITDSYFDLMDRKVYNIQDRIEYVVDELSLPKALTVDAVERADVEMASFGFKPTDWIVYNSLNYALNHSNDSLLGRKADAMDKKVFTALLEGI